MSEVGHIAATIARAAKGRQRIVVAIAGAPGSGKSTLAEALADALVAGGQSAAVVPMDGFHFDKRVLEARGLLARKGAPETFDVAGFGHLLKRLRAIEPDVAIPVFDRTIEIARAGGAIVESETRIILAEGNYLLLDEAPWRALTPLFDFTLYLSVSREELQRRLLKRWADLDRADGPQWVASNDMPNVDRVIGNSRKADIVVGH